jgi:acetyltransferase-like isoleucine patch superfamily enzyme
LARKLQVRRFCHRYNGDDDLIVKDDGSLAPERLFVALREERAAMLRTILGKIGEDAVIEPPFNFQYGFNIIMGDGCYGNVKLVYLLALENPFFLLTITQSESKKMRG